jgi:selenium metabolism protein YedF
MRIVDTKGQLCPLPIIETKKALKECETGESFVVITDNSVSYGNISRFLKDNKIRFNVSVEKGVWSLKITKEGGEAVTTSPDEYCGNSAPLIPAGDYAVVISSEIMGQGDDELGKKLMNSFINVVSCLDTMPSLIAFYNSGVKLTIRNSEVADILTELEKKGVQIMICGTCVEHFGIGDQISLGEISDMYLITSALASAGNIIRP